MVYIFVNKIEKILYKIKYKGLKGYKILYI